MAFPSIVPCKVTFQVLPHGIGHAFDPPHALHPGDAVGVAIEVGSSGPHVVSESILIILIFSTRDGLA